MQLHERFLADIAAERRGLSRRRLLGSSAKVAGGGAVALSLAGLPVVGRAQDATPEATPVAVEFESDVDVLNYALTLEHLENAFYRDGIGLFDFGVDTLDLNVNEQLAAISAHEATHVQALTDTIVALGGTPVEEQVYDFEDAYESDTAFLETAAVFENLGVSAYNGAGQFLTDPALLTTAGTIVSVEARHAAYLNYLIEENPFPDAFDEDLSPEEVLAAAGPFIAS
jgi:rubrerythrin